MLGKDMFVSPEVVELPVDLPGGAQKLWFRKVSSYDWDRFVCAIRSPDIEQRALSTHILVAASLCDPDGEPAMTLDKAKQLVPDAAEALFAAAAKLNRRTKPKEGEAGNA